MNKDLLAPIEWHNEERVVKDLVPYNYNPRKITTERLERLKASLEKFNLAEIPAINTDNVIVAGHQRVKVLMELGRGDEIIDVRVPNRKLTESEFKEYNITSNVPTGYWDLDILEEIFADIDLEALGLNVNEIVIPDDLLDDQFKLEEEDDFDSTPPKDPISKLGDVFEFKSKQKKLIHKLICGDAREAKDYKNLMFGEMADLLITDPPYNVDYQGGTKKKLKIKNDKMSDESFYSFLYRFYQEAFLNVKAGGSYYIFHADSEGANFRIALTDAGFKLAQCLIWVKNSMVMGRQDYHWQHEPILYGWKEGAAHKWYSDRSQKTVLNFNKPLRNEEHPTMKPLDLIKYLLKNSSKQFDIVLDVFLGSGSTLIACEQTWRNCYSLELDPIYVDVSVRRYIKYMQHNKLEFTIKMNGRKLTEEQLTQFLENE